MAEPGDVKGADPADWLTAMGLGWKSHITTGAAGAGWTGWKDVGQQNGSIREGQRQRDERMLWSVWVETLQRKCLMTILRLCLSGKTACFFLVDSQY